jgi:hypothetical protein
MTTRRPRHPIRVISVNRPTPDQAQAMIRAAAPQIAALLDWAERDSSAKQKQQEEAA